MNSLSTLIKKLFKYSPNLLGACACLVLISCSDTSEKPTNKLTISASKINNNPNLTPAEKAEELAKGAEQLLTAEGFPQANSLARKALKQDPQNLRAGFIKALTDPVILLKGYLIRFKPLAPNQDLYEKELGEKRELAKTSPLERFFLDGKPEFKTEAQAQVFFDQLFTSIEQLRIFARDHKDAELTIKANSLISINLNQVYAESCELIETPNYEYVVTCPDNRIREEVALNHADFEFLQHAAAYGLFTLSLLNSYDLTGLHQMGKLKEAKPEMKPQQIYNKLMKNPKFGILRKHQGLSRIKDLTLDIFAGLQWAMDNYSSLCPMGESNAQNRMGMLFYAGLCVPKSTAPYVQQGIDFVIGKPMEATFTHGTETHIVLVNYMSLINQPLPDLRNLGPLKFNNCGNIIGAGDPSLGGTFPNKDANEKLPLIQPQCNE